MDHAEREADFTAYVRAREQVLARLAYLLTGERDAAEDLLQNTLAKVYRHWARIQEAEAPDA
jgi:DNA-directed RNA polymerase specialized sigma24 family protein